MSWPRDILSIMFVRLNNFIEQKYQWDWTQVIPTLDSPLPNQIQTIAYTMVDSMIRTHFLDENNFSFTHSHIYSTRPVVARCVFTFTIQIYKGGIFKYNFK